MKKKGERLRIFILILSLSAALLLAVLNGSFLKRPMIRVKEIPVIKKSVEPKIIHPVEAPENAFILESFSFDTPESLKKWEEKTFKSGTVYKVLNENGRGFLKCSSENSSSGLYVKVEHSVTPDLVLSWRWRAENFPKKKKPEELGNKEEDDFAARVYIIFPGANFFKSDVIEYVWDAKLPVGFSAVSAYSTRIQLLVLESGASSGEAAWKREERNVWQDYRLLFKKEPSRALGVVALMSDSDNTGTSAEADFADFVLKLKNTNNDDLQTGVKKL